jgi:hypothetical protein
MPDFPKDFRAVAAREYKLILTTERFGDRAAGSTAFRKLAMELARAKGGTVVDKQKGEEVRRTWYLDTPGNDLRRHEFALRVRLEGGKEYKTTLKCRSADRYLAASHSLAGSDKIEEKFEEDILPPFQSRFSNSAIYRSKSEPRFATVGDVAKIFPGFAKLPIAPEAKLAPVNDLHIHEIFRKLCQVDFGPGPAVKAGISFWYLTEKTDEWPLIAEFSFDYAPEKPERFPARTVERANAWFTALQGLPGWFNFDATTKTRFAYEGPGG